MRLLTTNIDDGFKLKSFIGNKIPKYSILSHTWDSDEVTLQDIKDKTEKNKDGYSKVQFCRERAEQDQFEYFWIDSCCIDKTSSSELSESINSMFRWYQRAEKCYVYLSDVSACHYSQSHWETTFKQSKWFKRGWTLQELLASQSIEFYSHDNVKLGDKHSLEQQIHEATGIPIEALQGKPLYQFTFDERLSWMANRETTIEEDFAYCLLGILNVHMPQLYGEGVENAFIRLIGEINNRLRIYKNQSGKSILQNL